MANAPLAPVGSSSESPATPPITPEEGGASASSSVASMESLSSRGSGLSSRLFFGTTTTFGVVLLVLPIAMLIALAVAARSSIATFGFGFLTSSTWDPVKRQFGAAPFIFGTIVSSVLALLIAAPISLGVAIFLSELAPHRVRKPLGLLVELLAAIPSVVYGFWGIFVLVPLMREYIEPFLQAHLGFLPLFDGEPLGFGMFSAGVILAIMIVPTITSIAREVLRAVPMAQREAAAGLGATRWDVIRYAVVPAARSGLIGAILLGFNRALGETMAVTMVIGNRPKISGSLFAPGATMASVIANEFAEADSSVYLSALAEIGLLLLVLALILNLIARGLVGNTKKAARA
jgi:phosphate transport system permease protein